MTVLENLAEELTAFGLTRQEANIYLTLITQGPLTGYEVAKQTGISRSNTYSALSDLTDKGATCYEIEGTVTRYFPLDLKEFTTNVIEHMKRKQKIILTDPPKAKEKIEGYITINGLEHVMDKVRNMILSANNRIYFVASGEILHNYNVELGIQIKKGIKVVLLTNGKIDIPNCTVYPMENIKNQMRLIVDSSDILTGNIDGNDDCSCLYSKNPDLVDVFKEMMRSEIVLLEQKYQTQNTVLVAMPKEI